MSSLNGSVPTRAALAWLTARPVSPALAPLGEAELSILRCPRLDDALMVDVIGHRVPRDLLRGTASRARFLRDHVPQENSPCELPRDALLYGTTALWVHTGLRPPRRLVVAVSGRPGPWRSLECHKVTVGPPDRTQIEGLACVTLARAAVDVARTARPVHAVEAVIAALAAGETGESLHRTLQRCPRGSVGTPRARGIIDALSAPPP